MVIPKDTVLLLYSPVGSPIATMAPRKGMAPWVVNFSAFGKDTQIPIDGHLWGSAVFSGSGSIQYVYLPRDLVNAVHLDTVSPLLAGTLVVTATGSVTVTGGTITVSGNVGITGTPAVSISGTPTVTITSGAITITAGTVTLNGANRAALLASQASGSITAPGTATATLTVPASTIWYVTGIAVEVTQNALGAATASSCTVFRNVGSQSQVPIGADSSSTALTANSVTTFFEGGLDAVAVAVPGGAAAKVFLTWSYPLKLVAGQSLFANVTLSAELGGTTVTVYVIGYSEPL
jgi:hypothetical protein